MECSILLALNIVQLATEESNVVRLFILCTFSIRPHLLIHQQHLQIWNPIPIFIDVVRPSSLPPPYILMDSSQMQFTTILMSRFILNLREVFTDSHPRSDGGEATTSINLSIFTVPRFAGNLGAPLDHSLSLDGGYAGDGYEDAYEDSMLNGGGDEKGLGGTTVERGEDSPTTQDSVPRRSDVGDRFGEMEMVGMRSTV